MTWQTLARIQMSAFENYRLKSNVTWEDLWDFDLMYQKNLRNFDMIAAGDLNVRRPV